LITECEILEQAQAANPKGVSEKGAINKEINKSGKTKTKSKNSDKAKGQYYCTECGNNVTHETSSCYKLINRTKRIGNMPADGKTPAKPFSKRTFCKEINVVIRKASNHKSLNLFESAMKHKQICQQKLSKKSAVKESSESKSTSLNGSVHVLEPKFPKIPKKKVLFDTSDEEEENEELKPSLIAKKLMAKRKSILRKKKKTKKLPQENETYEIEAPISMEEQNYLSEIHKLEAEINALPDEH